MPSSHFNLQMPLSHFNFQMSLSHSNLQIPLMIKRYAHIAQCNERIIIEIDICLHYQVLKTLEW